MSVQPLRALLCTRISVLNDDTKDSPERQLELVTYEANNPKRGYVIVGHVEDLDVSASKYSPWERPELGPYFTEPDKIAQWDVLIFYRLDRFVRSVKDIADMLDWCKKNGKYLLSASEAHIDTTAENDMSEVFIYLATIFAQMEARTIAARISSARKRGRDHGRHVGGATPFGLRSVKHPDWGWSLEHDEYALLLLKIIDRVIEGDSRRSIVIELNEDQVPTSRDIDRRRQGKPMGSKKSGNTPHIWTTTTLTRILTSRYLLGDVTYQGEVVRAPDGMPIKRCEPFIDRAIWDRLQRALQQPDRAAKRKDASMLLRALYAECGRPYHYKKGGPRNTSDYYNCEGRPKGLCKCRTVRSDFIEPFMEKVVLRLVGSLPRMREEIDPGEDHTAELAEAEAELTELISFSTGMPEGKAKDIFRRQVESLSNRIARYEAMPTKPSVSRWVATGETYAEYWARLDHAGRNRFLRDSGVRAVVTWPASATPRDKSKPNVNVTVEGFLRMIGRATGSEAISRILGERLKTIVEAKSLSPAGAPTLEDMRARRQQPQLHS